MQAKDLRKIAIDLACGQRPGSEPVAHAPVSHEVSCLENNIAMFLLHGLHTLFEYMALMSLLEPSEGYNISLPSHSKVP